MIFWCGHGTRLDVEKINVENEQEIADSKISVLVSNSNAATNGRIMGVIEESETGWNLSSAEEINVFIRLIINCRPLGFKLTD